MPAETGTITVNADKIFPIIKQSLYPHREVFLREAISNATDALSRFQFLSLRDSTLGEGNEELRVDIRTDKVARTLSIEDNGDGMTRDEVKTNINEVAFSGTQKFLETYKPDIKMIGFFGLGFYSIFMVAKEAWLETKSYKTDADACKWSSKGDGRFQLDGGDRAVRGTKITLAIEPDHEEFLEPETLERLIRKYSDYMPFPIYLNGRNVNTVHAPWHLSKNELTSQDYLRFYQKLNPDANDPLFWLHVNIEGQVNLRGVLYIPDRPIKNGNIRFFCNRVFVQEHCVELVPQYLAFLDGVIDTEDLPLNVSRDKFQEDKKTQVIRNFIKKKMAREIVDMAKTKRADFMRFWDAYSREMKMGGLMDDFWFKELSAHFLFPSSTKPLTTIEDYQARAENKHAGEIYYLTDRIKQSQHLTMFKQRNLEVLYMDDEIDFLILKRLRGEESDTYELKRIDTVVHPKKEQVVEESESTKSGWQAFQQYFAELVPKEVTISLESLPSADISGIFKMQADDADADDAAAMLKKILNADLPQKDKNRIFVLNKENALVRSLFRLFEKNKNSPLLAKVCAQTYQHALASTGEIKQGELASILSGAEKIMTAACEAELKS